MCFICVCVCMYVCMYIYIYIYIGMCTYMSMHVLLRLPDALRPEAEHLVNINSNHDKTEITRKQQKH